MSLTARLGLATLAALAGPAAYAQNVAGTFPQEVGVIKATGVKIE